MFFKRTPSITWSELSRDDVIIDVREPHEFKVKSAHRAKNVPLSKISTFSTHQTVYVMCQSGIRSKRAVKMMRKNGIDAINIKGGMMAYGK